MFRAITAKDKDGDEHVCWDGVFARNPPIREFTNLEPEPPEEIWVVRINPVASAQEPVTMPEIIDRRNELSGNLSLDQEIYFIEKINELRQKSPEVAALYQHIEIRQVELSLDLDYPSKVNRGIRHTKRLIATGREAAPKFFHDDSKDKVMVKSLVADPRDRVVTESSSRG